MKWIISVAVLAAVAFMGTSAVRPQTTPRPPCTPNASWKEGCNDCVCDASERAVCTERACPAPPPPPGRCAPGSVWRESCNTCRCTAGGVGICTMMACLSDGGDQQVEGPQPLPDVDRPTGALCLEGQTWQQDCNTCNCRGGRAVCSQRACLPSADTTTTESGRCIPGSTWKVRCNTCSCVGGRAACTQMACIGGAGASEPELVLSVRPKMDAEGRCVTAAVWKDDCNTCRCDQHFYPRCTLIGCLGQGWGQQETANRAKRATCTEGQVWKDDCNTCRCGPTGLAACTKMRCIKPQDLQQLQQQQEQQQQQQVA